jgi:hypothetical protein
MNKKTIFKKAENVAFIFIILLLGLPAMVQNTELAPKNAYVVADSSKRTYYSIPYAIKKLEPEYVMSLDRTTYASVLDAEYKVARGCREDFANDQGSLLKEWVFNILGLEQKSRWNPDGDWNW